jgi:hypothetical protein
MLSQVGAFESVQHISKPQDATTVAQLTLKISHVRPNVRVQRIDDHLAVRWSSNLNTSVHKTWCWRRASPCIILPDVLGLWQEVEDVTLVKLGLSDIPSLKESLACAIERAVEHCEEDGSILAKYLSGLVIERAQNINVIQSLVDVDGANMAALIPQTGYWCVRHRWFDLISLTAEDGMTMK